MTDSDSKFLAPTLGQEADLISGTKLPVPFKSGQIKPRRISLTRRSADKSAPPPARSNLPALPPVSQSAVIAAMRFLVFVLEGGDRATVDVMAQKLSAPAAIWVGFIAAVLYRGGRP